MFVLSFISSFCDKCLVCMHIKLLGYFGLQGWNRFYFTVVPLPPVFQSKSENFWSIKFCHFYFQSGADRFTFCWFFSGVWHGRYSNVRYLQAGVTDWPKLEGACGGHLVQPSAQAGPATASCPGLFNISEDKDSIASLGNLCQCSVTLTVEKNVTQYSGGTSNVSVCDHCLWSCQWAPLIRAWLHPPDTLPSGIYVHS